MSTEPVAFATAQDWNDWLGAHQDAAEVWVLYWKKGTGVPSIDWQQAVIEALCWGWIDGIRKSVDGQRFMQRFTPRRAGSSWSAINRAHAERLITEGRMQPAGLAAIEAARANGRWDATYSGGMGAAQMPPAFEAALAAAPPLARTTWNAMNARQRFVIYYRVTTAKRSETQGKRIEGFIAALARGEREM